MAGYKKAPPTLEGLWSVSKKWSVGAGQRPARRFCTAKSVAVRRKYGYFPSGNPKNTVFRRAGQCPAPTLLVSGVRKGEVEQKFADWTSVLDMVSPVVVEESVSRVYDRALSCERKDSSSNVFETLVNLFQKYFYDPNSPLRDEERYLPFVCRYASYEGLSEVEKEKYEREARLCSLNRVGHKATDFRFSDRRGRMMNLYDVKAELTLLFFSNPGCEACMNIINVLRGEPAVSRLITDGRMAVVNVYIDEDIQEWMSYMPVYPEEWYNGFDPDLVLRNNDLYNIRAIPSLYLLDSEKRIIMKDAPEGRLFNYLSSF